MSPAREKAPVVRWSTERNLVASGLCRNVARGLLWVIHNRVPEVDLGIAETFVTPTSLVSGERFSDLNILSLLVQARARGQKDCRFVTREDLLRLRDEEGGPAALRASAKPYYIVVPRPPAFRKLASVDMDTRIDWSRVSRDDEGTLRLEEETTFVPVELYSVADTTADVPALVPKPRTGPGRMEFADALFSAFGVKIVEDTDADYALYMRDGDFIRIPPLWKFRSSEHFYMTLFHEFYHWTGSPKREKRKRPEYHGSREYCREEVRAELFASVMCIVLDLNRTFVSNASYAKQWLTRLHYEEREIIRAADDIARVVGAILDVGHGRRPTLRWMREKDFSRVPPVLAEIGLSLEDFRWKWRDTVESVKNRLATGAGDSADPARMRAAGFDTMSISEEVAVRASLERFMEERVELAGEPPRIHEPYVVPEEADDASPATDRVEEAAAPSVSPSSSESPDEGGVTPAEGSAAAEPSGADPSGAESSAVADAPASGKESADVGTADSAESGLSDSESVRLIRSRTLMEMVRRPGSGRSFPAVQGCPTGGDSAGTSRNAGAPWNGCAADTVSGGPDFLPNGGRDGYPGRFPDGRGNSPHCPTPYSDASGSLSGEGPGRDEQAPDDGPRP